MNRIHFEKLWRKMNLPPHIVDIFDSSEGLLFPKSREHILRMAMGGRSHGTYEVAYEVPGIGRIVEATVTKCTNGLGVNYLEPYMRRRDPNCMLIADNRETDKSRYQDRFGVPFETLRSETFDWFRDQRLIVTLFSIGGFDETSGQGAMLIAPENAGFFVGGLADLQGMIPPDQIPENFNLRSIIYLAPPFRHTHFEGKQIVIHNRLEGLHEVFSYNLYPGPSAKKGVYGVLLAMGEDQDWPTLHGSTVQVVTPYDNITTIMHEGASGGGKSEMLEYVHRQEDGRLLLGRNLVTGEQRYLTLNQACKLQPVTDDMAMCLPNDQHPSGYLLVKDAEQAWFVRINHILRYGVEPHLEEICIHPKEPLIFLNLRAVPDSTCLIWDHIQDKPGVACPNPRVILPRRLVPDAVDGTAEVMIRSFGLRTPPCTQENPTYGIAGYMHVLPAALAWLWRLVAPRGHGNPSITASEGMASEGVGSYWPFATGRIVDHANLLLRQIQATPKVRYVLLPNQHVGAYEVSFMPQWIGREYLGRRGVAKFNAPQLSPSRCHLLGYGFNSMQVEGAPIPPVLLDVEKQPEVGTEGFDAGMKILQDFFDKELKAFLHPDLDPLGKQIIECCLNNGTVQEYENLLYGVFI